MGPPPTHAGRDRSRRSIAVASVLAVCALAAVPTISIAARTQATQDEEKKVTICHRDSDEKQPYGPGPQSVSVNSILGDGGHAGHTGPVFPGRGPDGKWGDIIPAFTYGNEVFEGLNWPDNTGIYQNSCQLPPQPTPTGTITVVKELIPSDDSGTFNLKVGGETVAEGVGNQGSGSKEVTPGTPYEVSESGAGETSLGDYDITSSCTTKDGKEVGTSHGDSVSDVTVAQDQTVKCIFTNQVKPPPDSVTPILECVLFKDGQPDVAYWGYDNTSGYIVTVPRGDPKNTFEPASANGKQPEQFVEGHQVGVFQTDFDASSGSLVWHLTGNEETASAGSEPCKATIEVQKVTVPSSDPGKFNLLINNTVVAAGGNGTTSGPLRIGAGEGAVRETAQPGTNLGDYTSKVECTNGTRTVSAAGTKLDATIAKDDNVVCTFTNTRKGTPPEPTPTPTPPTPTPTPPTPPPVPSPPPGPQPQLDLVVTKSVEPQTVVVGRRLTWTMTVTNRSSVAAADVNGLKLDDPRSFRTRLISLRASQGTCVPYTCSLGRLAPGASATVTAVTEATRVGVVVDIVRVGSEEIESNYRNNVAAALAQVVGRLTPPAAANRCDTLTVAPRFLQNRRSSVVLLRALDGRGRPLAGLRVRVHGTGVDTTVTTNRRGAVRRTVLPRRTGLFFFTGLPRTRTGGGMHCRTLLGVLGAASTEVTG